MTASPSDTVGTGPSSWRRSMLVHLGHRVRARHGTDMITLLITTNLELCSVFIQPHGMSEVGRFVGRRTAQWQFPGDESNAGDAVKHTDKIHGNVDAEGPLKL